MPNARVVEGPEQRADVDDDDEGNEHATEDLELSVDAAGANVVCNGEIVAAQKKCLDDVDASGGKPADGDDHRDDERVPRDIREVFGQRQQGKDQQNARQDEDGTRWAAQMLLQAEDWSC